MASRLVRRIWSNLGTFALSFVLAMAVWISAVVAADPNEECAQPNTVSLEVTGKDSDLLVIGELPKTISVRLQAPTSICRELASQPELVRAFVDLTGILEGDHTLLVAVDPTIQPVRILEILPREIIIVLEELARIELPIATMLSGEPARGFQTEPPVLEFERAQVSGPQSLVERVVEIWAELDIGGAQATISEEVSLNGVDQNGQTITGVSIEPQTVRLTQSIIQSGGFRTVAVRVETVGQPSSGYRLTTIQVSPPTVTISSADPQQIEDLPGFVSTQPLDLSELTENAEVRLSLELPTGVFVEGEQTVLVFVGITAIEGTAVMSVPVEIIGLAAGLEAQISPETVDVFLSGPVTILNTLTLEDVRVFADLTEYGDVGTHLVELTVEILPDRVQLDSINPIKVEVNLIIQLTPIGTPTATPTATPTPKP
jgi:YbbR domain-containing protein